MSNRDELENHWFRLYGCPTDSSHFAGKTRFYLLVLIRFFGRIIPTRDKTKITGATNLSVRLRAILYNILQILCSCGILLTLHSLIRQSFRPFCSWQVVELVVVWGHEDFENFFEIDQFRDPILVVKVRIQVFVRSVCVVSLILEQEVSGSFSALWHFQFGEGTKLHL